MKSCHKGCLASVLLFFIISSSIAQDQRAFNQNASRTNTRAFNQNAARSNHGLSITFSPLYSIVAKSKSDSLLFRGSGAGFGFGADYFFGKAGISFSSGFSSSSPDDATINDFLKRFPFSPDELVITKSRQQSMYLLLGPSVTFGKMVALYAHAKGGLFINNSGLVNIQQKGAQRSVYRNESTPKSVYPGFVTGMRVQYSTRSEIWSFGIGADYMSTKSEVNNFDARRGGAIDALKLSRNITDIVTGVTVRYNIFSPRDQSSGQASGKRQVGKPKYEDSNAASAPRESGSGLATGRRSYQPGQPVYGNITNGENCGAVTQKITHPDGTMEEMTFACPDDAANYNSRINNNGGMPNRISMNVTTPKQTQGATFGEKVNAGLHAAGGAISQGAKQGIVHRDLAARNIISGKLTWTAASEGMGIITNNTMGRGGSTTMNSQTSSTRTTQQSSFGTMVRLSARDASSGMASGKRSRESGTGMATGRRQYEPIFSEDGGDVCNPCLASAKMSNTKNNPLYEDKGNQGSNPIYEGKSASGGGDDDCDGIAGMTVSLTDPQSGAVIAKTITGSCGDFFFANVPDGDYVVRVSGSFISKKGYDVNTKSKTDLLGKVSLGDESMQLMINTGDGGEDMTQKAGISTSRSNIRTKSITIIEADLDGDGEYESLRANGTFSDGTTADITSSARKSVSNVPGTKGIVLDKNVFNVSRRRVEVLKSNKTGDPNANRQISSVTVSENNGKLTATGTFSDGSTRDITESVEVNRAHDGIRQYTITVSDMDDDGAADAIIKTKTKSNQSNDRMAGGDADNDGVWSPRSNIKVLRLVSGDVDGDGLSEMSVAAPFVPGGSVVTAAMRPGNPIGGLTIKGGRNPGGNLRTVQTDGNGEFEFPGLDAGDYTFTLEQKVVIEDETFISTGNTVRAQDHNSSRSNKTASAISNEPGGGDAGGNTKVQDHNSSRSNKSSSSIAGDPNNGEAGDRKGDVKLTASQNSQSLRTLNTTRGNIKSLLASLDDLNDQLDNDATSNRYLVNTSRSNIKNQRLAIYDVQETLANIPYMDRETATNELDVKSAAMSRQFLALLETLKAMGGQYNTISNVLKTKHDTAKNAIGNIR